MSLPDRAAKDFGRYLRELRGRGHLTLERVEQLTLHHGHRLPKSQLSRLETGRALPDLRTVSVLSAIYRVPATEMAQHYDAEHLRRSISVELEGRTDAQLLAEAKALILGGDYARLLALATAARERLELGDRSEASQDRATRRRRQFWLYEIDALVHLGYHSVGKAECETLTKEPNLSLEHEISALQLFAACCRHLELHLLALSAIDMAERRMPSGKVPLYFAPQLIMLRANVLTEVAKYAEASEAHSRALQLNEAIGDPLEACRARIQLGWSLLQDGKSKTARQNLEAAVEQAGRSGYGRLKSLALSNLAVLAFRAQEHDSAERYALLSNEALREISYPEVYFRNSFYLREIARSRSDEIGAARYEAALKSLVDRMPRKLPEAEAFRRFLAEERQAREP